MNKNLY